MNLEGYKLGETDTLIELHTAEENHVVARELIRQAKREVWIMSYDLDPMVLSHEDIAEALSAFIRQGRQSHLRVLVQKSEKVVKQGHRLIPLAHRMSSRISLNKPGFEHRDYFESFMVVDGIGFYKRLLSDRFEGVASFKAPVEGRDLRALFISMWQHSEPDPELRRLRI
ncbi:MAG: hypothetical protein OQL05_02090 [Gammaproteobacteria bacterium]|nr:hypothetical protein [Gammaproteobacteria bacterium]MCW8958103.1 hypothetical protein [Gammaproteobacteria bacterium]MCW8972053.1 hypothetical protein [Gammaproteobacteria bacterium]MCW8993829.1 hypothetical protein [Gammaproteobacteria bacterium]